MTGRHPTQPLPPAAAPQPAGLRPGFTAPTTILMADGRQLPIWCLQRGDPVQNHSGGIARVVSLLVQRLGPRALCGFNTDPPFFTEGLRFLATDGWRCLKPSPGEACNLYPTLGPLLSGCRLLHWNHGYRKSTGKAPGLRAAPLFNAYDIDHIEERHPSPATRVFSLVFDRESIIISSGFLVHGPTEEMIPETPLREYPLKVVR
ncbi:hypothetical protein [Aestuariirhabdus litorea]|uniref:Uncharacterized protein n=1 Tax=Aestuariirhabdus litorea TaxID=2528527 RepID=A0A3P3VP31_9GAMM|nr:hypothetical protein [Aestuariirhabdus litorea]RRJ84107.1 hypothetical protein D0544_03015 [Aestuariirhabdus litorea]RWW97327.1 hypothetical protein DZC74_03010 [Endozoicomonadaceae bacterium GTF-13]